ncbi:MAG: hypothetical protein GY832_30570 [Chloroflexi bacterium]|nr:hypothetical protein [Chloroflexota bacterium]
MANQTASTPAPPAPQLLYNQPRAASCTSNCSTRPSTGDCTAHAASRTSSCSSSSGSAANPAQTAVPPAEGSAPAALDPFHDLYQELAELPDSPEKESMVETLEKLKAESEKGDDADEGAVEELIQNVAEVLPDVAEIAINTMVNPASGLTTLVQKVAKRVADKDDD